jgi:uncharacterized membrane protein
MNLTFEPIWSWPFIILVSAVILGVILGGYRTRIRHLPRTRRQMLWTLRLMLALLICFWMLRPQLRLESRDETDAVLYVLSDTSRSMQTPDEVGGTTRFDAVKSTHEDIAPLLEELGEQVEIRMRSFSDALSVADPSTDAPEGPLTAIGATLEEMAQESAADRVAAVILLGDGRQTSTGQKDVDPVLVARRLSRQQTPVYSVTYGRGEVSGNALDVSVSELDVSRDVFVRNVVPLRVRLRTSGVQGRPIRVRVLLEDRSQQTGGQSGPMVAISPDTENRTLYVHQSEEVTDDLVLDLQFVPQNVGELKLQIEAEPLDDEVRKTNNRVETIIRVRQGGIRVAYFDKIRSEQHWLRRIARSSRIELRYQPIREGRFSDRNDFQDDWFEIGNFDAFIIGDVPAEVFGKERLDALYRCCENGAGLMMTGGFENYGAGGYHNTPLARLLPVEMSADDDQLTDPITMHPTEIGRSSSIMQISSPELNRQRWSELPPLSGANLLRPTSGGFAQVLAESPTGAPLLIGQSVGSSRVLAFAGDTTWQWYMHEDWGAEAYQRFWRQVIFWITKKDADSDARIWVNVEPRNIMPGRTAQLTFGARDEQGVPIASAEYDVTVSSPEGTLNTLMPRRVDDQAAADFEDTLQPGDYWVHVNAKQDGTALPGTAITRFLVNDRDAELDDPAADPGLMREIAHISGGDALTPQALIERLQEWIDEGLPGLSMTHSERLSLWDNWYSLLLFVLLLCMEWGIRKKSGLV